MRTLTYLLLGTFFGVVMTKSEAISWYRIVEMFRFESFHMYGIIGTAVVVGVIGIQLAKRLGWRTVDGEAWNLKDKQMEVRRYLLGGTIFGLGWAMTGACPGPLAVLLGHGLWFFGVVILSAVLGTFVYGLLRPYLH